MTSQFTKVIARQLKNKNYRYFGVAADGTETVLRKSATRLYEKAFHYPHAVASGANGIAAEFTYGKAPGSYCPTPLAVFIVELVDETPDVPPAPPASPVALEISIRRANHATVQSSLAMHKAPGKVRELVQSISQEQLIALAEVGASLARNDLGGLHYLVDVLSGRIKEVDAEVMDWLTGERLDTVDVCGDCDHYLRTNGAPQGGWSKWVAAIKDGAAGLGDVEPVNTQPVSLLGKKADCSCCGGFSEAGARFRYIRK